MDVVIFEGIKKMLLQQNIIYFGAYLIMINFY